MMKSEKKYRVMYGTGAGDFDIVGSLEDAKDAADDGARCYTQQSIAIVDTETGETVCVRHWWGVSYDPDEDPEMDIIDFGKFGYYDEWREF